MTGGYLPYLCTIQASGGPKTWISPARNPIRNAIERQETPFIEFDGESSAIVVVVNVVLLLTESYLVDNSSACKQNTVAVVAPNNNGLKADHQSVDCILRF